MELARKYFSSNPFRKSPPKYFDAEEALLNTRYDEGGDGGEWMEVEGEEATQYF